MISRAKDFRSIQLELEMANGLDKSFDELVKENIKKIVKEATVKISAHTSPENMDLEPCPECGSDVVCILPGTATLEPDGVLYYRCKVFCEDCAHETGWFLGNSLKESRIEATIQWNSVSLHNNSTPTIGIIDG